MGILKESLYAARPVNCHFMVSIKRHFSPNCGPPRSSIIFLAFRGISGSICSPALLLLGGLRFFSLRLFAFRRFFLLDFFRLFLRLMLGQYAGPGVLCQPD